MVLAAEDHQEIGDHGGLPLLVEIDAHVDAPVELVVCMTDTLLHLDTAALVDALLQKVFAALEPGGYHAERIASLFWWMTGVGAVVWLFVIALALVASGHAIIYKREARSAALWVIVIWLVPALGPFLYALLGINRVQRRAARMRAGIERYRSQPSLPPGEPGGHFAPLARLVGNLVERPLLPGNALEVLVDGASAYPAMLEAIGSARSSIVMSSYIFDGVGIGAHFVQALGAALQEVVVEAR